MSPAGQPAHSPATGRASREEASSIDRRAVFLLCAAAVCLLLVPLSPSDLRYVGEVIAAWCVVLAAASWLDHWSRARS